MWGKRTELVNCSRVIQELWDKGAGWVRVGCPGLWAWIPVFYARTGVMCNLAHQQELNFHSATVVTERTVGHRAAGVVQWTSKLPNVYTYKGFVFNLTILSRLCGWQKSSVPTNV